MTEIEVYAPGTSLGKRDMLIGGAFFEQSIRLKLKGDQIPEAVAEEIIGELPKPCSQQKLLRVKPEQLYGLLD